MLKYVIQFSGHVTNELNNCKQLFYKLEDVLLCIMIGTKKILCIIISYMAV